MSVITSVGDFRLGQEVVVRMPNNEYFSGNIKSIGIDYNCNLIDYSVGKHLYNGMFRSVRATEKYTSTVKDKKDRFIFKREEVIKVGCRISLEPEQYNKLLYLVSEVKNKVYGTIVNTTGDWSIIMFDNPQHGFSYENMSKDLQEKIKALNIPNFHKRKFACISNNNLSFYPDDISDLSLHLEKQQRKETMSNKIVETLKGDAKEAAYRVAGTQITNGVKLGLIKLFESKGGKSEQMEMLKGLLDSELGDSVISLILGYGLNYAPGLKDDPRVKKLSEEFRINGMSVAGNAVIGAAMESFLPVLTGALNALPAEETSKPRIAEHTEEEEEDEESVVPPPRASKRAGGL